MAIYLNLTNYVSNWKRLGFSDEDIADARSDKDIADARSDKASAKPGSDRLVDAVVAYGGADAIAARLKEHLDAGADHVAVQALTASDKLVNVLAELAGPLGLK